METSIRAANINDLTTIQELNKRLFEYESAFGNTYNLDWTFSDKGRNYFEDRINGERGIVLVSEINGKIIGYICGQIDSYSFRSINPICEIENMFVLEEFRQKGVGKGLVNAFTSLAKEKGVKRLKVGVISQNLKAIAFYRYLGLSDFEVFLEKTI